TYTLTANVEELRLVGPDALGGTGNELDNRIVGNEYDNHLDGAGGADTLIGGLGDDTYGVDNAADTIVEYADQGSDTVESSIDYQLGSHLDNLQLVGQDDLLGQGNDGDNLLTGNAGDNSLYGGLGNDTLFGGSGNDLLAGEAGDDIYRYEAGSGVDRIEDSEGINALQFGEGIGADQVVARTSLVHGETLVQLRLLDQYVNELSDQGIDFVQAADGAIPIDSFNFADGTVSSLDDLLITQETYKGTRRSDQIFTDRNDDTIYAGKGHDLVNAAGGNDILYGEKGRDTLFAAAGDDQLYGGEGRDTLYGSFGQDVMHGGDDRDDMYGGTGNDLLYGAEDEDELHGGSGNDLLIGGQGDDELAISCGTDVIAYNQGDGWDEVEFGEEIESASLSLGGGINLADISLDRDEDDLIIGIEQESSGKKWKGWNRCQKKGDQGIVLDDWYANEDGVGQQPYLTLQVVMAASADFDSDATDPLFSQEIQTFDLSSVIAQYDLAQSEDSSGSQWDIMQVLLDNHLDSDDSEALGGSLAYQYGLGNKLFNGDELVVNTSQLADEQFGKDKQAIGS
ncbi:MAG: calcium-binding protein, partial [Pseudomonadota bacterium]|nr:calcium-binding protein [Pseudomonadota bacterium]